MSDSPRYLKSLASHFVLRDWQYARLHTIKHIRYEDDYKGRNAPWRRVAPAFKAAWESLYVGKAYSPRSRFDKHRIKPWWPEVSALVLYRHEFDGLAATVDRETDELEREAIADFNPHYNISRPLPQRDKGGVLSWR